MYKLIDMSKHKTRRKQDCCSRSHCAGKKKEEQKSYPRVKIGNEEIKNVLEFEYLRSNVLNNGAPEALITHSCNIARGHIGRYTKTLIASSLPVAARVRLHHTLIIITMSHSCEA